MVLLAGVGVAVEGHDGAGVAEPLLNLLECERAGLPDPVHEQARVPVPEVVEPHRRDSGRFGRPAPVPLVERGVAHGLGVVEPFEVGGSDVLPPTPRPTNTGSASPGCGELGCAVNQASARRR